MATLLVCAAAVGAPPLWFQTKAALAQVLLRGAWDDVLAGATDARPWPWADTAPVARLRVPELGIDQIVLSGDSGRTLAFGPGWANASAAPGTHGTTVVSGHRDTHFAFLRDLADGAALTLQTPDGERRYRIAGAQVVDSRTTRIDVDAGADRLLLVTCWPFEAVTAGGPMRYVVTAVPDRAGGGDTAR